MAEFVLAFPIIMLTIVFLIDTGILLFRLSLLTDATAALSRRVTTDLGQFQASVTNDTKKTCASLVGIAKKSKSILSHDKENLFENMTFKILINSNPDVPYQLVRIHGEFELRCLLCGFFSAVQPLTLKHDSVLAIERQFACTSPSTELEDLEDIS